MDTFDYLFCKARENGKVAKALSEKLQTEVDKNKIVDEIGNIDVGAIVRGIVKGTGVTLRDVVDTTSSISNYKYSNTVNINNIDYLNATYVGIYAMQGCISLTNVNMSFATNIDGYAMQNCISLKSIDLPSVTSIGDYAIYNCISLTNVNIPVAVSIGIGAMSSCISLTDVNMPVAVSISDKLFQQCISLKSVRLGANQVATLANTNAFINTPIARGTGYIYVPDELVEDYKVATNWSVYADQIRPISEYKEEEE